MKLDLWSILIIIIASQGLFLLVTLLFNKENRKRTSNRYLVLIVLVLIWFLAEFFAIRNKLDVGLSFFYGTRYGSWFLLGPLTYFYFKSITTSKWAFTKKQLWHFLPFVLFVIIIPFISYKALNNRQIDYGMLSVFDHREKVLTTIQWVYSFVFVIQFIHLAFFLFKNLKISKNYSDSLTKEYSNIDPRVSWLKYLNLTLILLLTLSAIFLYILLVTDIYRRHLDYIYVLPIGVLFYFISYKFMRANWQSVEKNGAVSKYSGSSLDDETIQNYVSKLEALMKEEKTYLDPKLRLGDLAIQLDISKHHLSQIINQRFNLSFFDYVNEYRIEEAKSIIASHPDQKLLHVAFDAGFNNKTSFVNAFKKFEGNTPSRFRENLKS